MSTTTQPIASVTRPRVRRSSSRPNYSVLDLFSGCGGFTEGLVSARNESGRLIPIGAVEIDEAAAATYAANFGSHVYVGDIADWIGTDLPAADVIVGGPPCQGFSTLGKQDESDSRNKLWRHYVEVVAAVQPSYFVLENVPPFLKSSHFEDLAAATADDGVLAGYTLSEGVHLVDASDYGAPQRRKRAIVIGRKQGLPPVTLPRVKDRVTVKDAIGHTSKKVKTTDLPQREVRIATQNRTLVLPGVYLTSELHVTRNFQPLSIDRFNHIPKGGNRNDLPDRLKAPCWLRHNSGSGDVMGRLHWDRPSVTIRTEFWKPEKGRYLHPEANRSITHLEAALLQGFPDKFRWCGNKTEIARQIGNAVPVPLGKAIGTALLRGLSDADISPR